jgi:hypothetical protein
VSDRLSSKKVLTGQQPKSQRALTDCKLGTAKSDLALGAVDMMFHQNIDYADMLLNDKANLF